jgi:hypothetical protein
LGLKFHQEIDIHPIPGPAYPPDDIVFAPAQILADETGADSLQGGKVQIRYPRFVYESLQQIPYHLRMGKQELITVIMMAHETSLTWRLCDL